MIHGTPVLDIKPYIADYDSPQNLAPLEDCNVHNNHHRSRAAFQCNGTTDSHDQRLLSGKAQPCCSAEETPKGLEDRTSQENAQKSRDSAETQHTLPADRERTVDLALESSRGVSMGMAEEQLGQHDLKSFLEEDTVRPRNVEGALVLQGNSAETPWDTSCHARTADRVPCSVVPNWVKEAPVAPLRVRFTPHAEKDLRTFSSGGELGYPGSSGSKREMSSCSFAFISYCAGHQDLCTLATDPVKQ